MSVRTVFEWVRELNRNPASARLVVQAIGIIGDPVSIPWLAEKTKVPTLARVAGEAFGMISGVDIECEWPEGFEAGPTQAPDDEDVAMDADEDLPWPAADLLTAWWAAHQHDYAPGRRQLCGQPICQKPCLNVLKTGFQRQRCAAALELALLNPGQRMFNTSTTAKRRMRWLGLR